MRGKNVEEMGRNQETISTRCSACDSGGERETAKEWRIEYNTDRKDDLYTRDRNDQA